VGSPLHCAAFAPLSAFLASPFAHWKGASGTVINADVFSKEQFFSGCEDFLYLYQHMATKSMCEVVVEGMGSTWDLCAKPNRHLSLKAAAEEAMICWSAPPPWHPSADVFINHAINHMVGKDADGKQKPWNFLHKGEAAGASLVTERLKKQPVRLPDAFYDCPL
jgi:hypothetical protein